MMLHTIAGSFCWAVRIIYTQAGYRALPQAPVKSLPAAQAAVGVPAAEVGVTADDYMHQLTPEARANLEARETMTEEVLAFAKENPEEAGKLLRIWLAEAREEE